MGESNIGRENQLKKNVAIGIIGVENNHTVGYGKLLNIEKKSPGVALKYVWGETEAFALRAQKEGAIPKIVKDPREMLGKIDALIVDHRPPKYHLPAAMPFLEVKIPIFIDKPFCYRAEEGRAFLKKAKTLGVPVTSYSSVAHTIQPLIYIFGDDIRAVRIVERGGKWTAHIAFGNGLMATLIFTEEYHGWNTFAIVKDGVKELKSRVPETDTTRNYVDMATMFQTGKMPRSFHSILNGVCVFEAMEKSVLSRKWEEVKYVKI